MVMLRLIGVVGVYLMAVVAFAQTALTVQTLSPERRVMMRAQELSGYIVARELATVNARLNGTTLEEIAVEVGDRVGQGEVLLRFDDALIKHELKQAQAQLQQARINLRQASDNAKRARALLREKAMSRLEGERLLAAEQAAKAALDIAVAQVDMQTLRLGYATVRAPVAGVVSEKAAVIGQTSIPGQALLTLIVDGALEWQAQVASERLTEVALGMEARVVLGDGMVVKGRVNNIAPTVDATTHQGTLFIGLAPHAQARAGLFVRGELLLGEYEALTLPARAVTIDDGYDFVWLVGEDDVVHKARVQVVAREGDLVVLEGLQEQARVVARGGGFLVDGDRVKVVDAAALGTAVQ